MTTSDLLNLYGINLKEMAQAAGVNTSYLSKLLVDYDNGKVVKGKVGLRCIERVNRFLRNHGANR